jgi:hypothetical protein
MEIQMSTLCDSQITQSNSAFFALVSAYRTPLVRQIALWSAQVPLFLFFGMAGVTKTFVSLDALVPMGIVYAWEIPRALLRFIGISELAGAIGIVLPALTRIKPSLRHWQPWAS